MERRILLLASVFVVSACGLVYELVAGAVSSYLMGDAVTQFSFVIGVFLCAMGVGAYLAKFIKTGLLGAFIGVQVLIGLVGGLSSMAMYAVNAFAEPIFPVFFYALCAVIGTLVGIEIPLLVRILEEESGLRAALSNVLALDYVGALAGSVAFPLVVLPFVGLCRASAVFGLMNLAVAALGTTIMPRPRRRQWLRIGGATVVVALTLVFSGRLVGFLEDMLYQDSVILAETTPHQRIVVTRWRDDVRLYLNGHLQFSSVDEARYHEALVLPAMESVPSASEILILGGGDGMAAREVLKYESVSRVTLCDIDPAMTRVAGTRREFRTLNADSLRSPKVRIVNTDAMKFLEEDRGFYDVVIADLPDPSSHALARLYSTAFFSLAFRRLTDRGAFVTHATSPFFAREAFWCIQRTMAEAGRASAAAAFRTHPYHVNVPSFGEWGFVLASRRDIEPSALAPSVPTRFLDAKALPAMFAFGKDVAETSVAVNRLDDPVLFGYYRSGWREFNR
ncbi:MAG: polyamine aminopropyltransferase [Deltaproteobacteria bacterium]|nr:polyamine aminopropyltransferase [Deltaproteobacteria bacterium]